MGYPLELNIFDLCSEDRRKKFEAPRQVGIQFVALLSEMVHHINWQVVVKILVYKPSGQNIGLQTQCKEQLKGPQCEMTDVEVHIFCLSVNSALNTIV